MSTYWKRIYLYHFFAANDFDAWVFLLVFCLNNNFLRESGLLIDFSFEGNSFFNSVEVNRSIFFSDDHTVERIEFTNHIILLHNISCVYKQNRTVRKIHCSHGDTCFRIVDFQFSRTSNNNSNCNVVFFSFNCTKIFDFNDTRVFRFQVRINSRTRRSTTRVERTKSQLCTWLTNRLCSNNTNSQSFLNQTSRGKVTTVTLRTNTTFAFAG